MEFENNKKIAAALAVVIVVTALVIYGVLMKMGGDDELDQKSVPEVQQEGAVQVEEIKKQIENFEAAQPEVKVEDYAKEPAVEDIKKQMDEAERTGIVEGGPSVEEIKKQMDQVK